MINAILRFSVERRFLTLSLILVLVGVGLWSFQRLPIDAVPDITNVQVQINTEAPGYSPLEIEPDSAVAEAGERQLQALTRGER